MREKGNQQEHEGDGGPFNDCRHTRRRGGESKEQQERLVGQRWHTTEAARSSSKKHCTE